MANAKIRERIRRLKEMTAARGCTEAEAMAAAEKVAQLMRDHGIADADLSMDEQASTSRTKGNSQKARLWPVIATCTNTAIVMIEDSGVVRVSFVGREPGPELAVYLRQVCERAIDREVAAFKKRAPYRRKRSLAVKRQMVAAFTIGMAGRLSQRLLEIFGPSRDEEASREALIALNERYPGCTDLAPPRSELRHMDAAVDGFLAAESVTLAHGVGSSAERLMIGGAS